MFLLRNNLRFYIKINCFKSNLNQEHIKHVLEFQQEFGLWTCIEHIFSETKATGSVVLVCLVALPSAS